MKSYTLIELTKGLDYKNAGASSLNDNGDALFGVVDSASGLVRSFVWKRGTLVEIVSKHRGNVNYWGGAINDACEVVGSIGEGYETQEPYHWKNGQMYILPSVRGDVTYAVGINNSGLIVGTALIGGAYGILWKDGKIIDTGRSISKHPTHFVSINDRGDIAGYEVINGKSRTFIYSGKSVEYVPTDLNCTPHRINNYKHVIGSINSNDRRKETAFLFADRKLRELGTLGGARSRAYDVNDSMTVVGESYFGSKVAYHGFVWKNGKMMDLNRLLNERDIEFVSAIAVNNHGHILCVGNSKGKANVYLLQDLLI